MDAFDGDVRDLVKVHVIHGFWKNEDPARLRLKVNSFSVYCTSFHSARYFLIKAMLEYLTYSSGTSCKVPKHHSPYGFHA
jgi:hypothetical protein